MALEGRVAVVTGGTRGIGRGIVQALLDAGATVAFSGRGEEQGVRTLSELEASERAMFVMSDATEADQQEHVVDRAVAQFGQLDVLVNNVGGGGGNAPCAQLSDDAWQHAFLANVDTTFWSTRRALQHMLPRKYGRIINVASVAGLTGAAEHAHYCAAKHAVVGFTRAVAREVGRDGITINALCPGLVKTEVVAHHILRTARSSNRSVREVELDFGGMSALGRLNTVEEVAAAALWLASDAGGGINGAVLPVDGGWLG